MEFPMSYAPPPPAQHSPLYNYSNTAGADSTAMAVVTGILLSTFFLLALVAFYLCKCMPGDGGSRARAIATKQASKGLSSDVLKRLPVVGYKELVKLRGGADSLGDCPICLSEYSVSDENLGFLPNVAMFFMLSVLMNGSVLMIGVLFAAAGPMMILKHRKAGFNPCGVAKWSRFEFSGEN